MEGMEATIKSDFEGKVNQCQRWTPSNSRNAIVFFRTLADMLLKFHSLLYFFLFARNNHGTDLE